MPARNTSAETPRKPTGHYNAGYYNVGHYNAGCRWVFAALTPEDGDEHAQRDEHRRQHRPVLEPAIRLREVRQHQAEVQPEPRRHDLQSQERLNQKTEKVRSGCSCKCRWRRRG